MSRNRASGTTFDIVITRVRAEDRAAFQQLPLLFADLSGEVQLRNRKKIEAASLLLHSEQCIRCKVDLEYLYA